MTRRPFTILSALSLLLFLASMGMRVRSYWRWDSIAYRGERHLYTLDSGSGHVGVMAAHLVRDTPYARGWSVYSDPAHEVAGGCLRRGSRSGGTGTRGPSSGQGTARGSSRCRTRTRPSRRWCCRRRGPRCG